MFQENDGGFGGWRLELKYIILIYVLCEDFFSIIGANLSKPHTSRESGLLACLQMSFSPAGTIQSPGGVKWLLWALPLTTTHSNTRLFLVSTAFLDDLLSN